MNIGDNMLYKDLCYTVVGAAMEVHSQLGNGFLEAVYHEALCLELKIKETPYEREKEFKLEYKGITLDKKYKADLIVDNKIIIELKSRPELTIHDEAQLLNYLKCTGYRLGLLINFGKKSLEWKRIIL